MSFKSILVIKSHSQQWHNSITVTTVTHVCSMVGFWDLLWACTQGTKTNCICMYYGIDADARLLPLATALVAEKLRKFCQMQFNGSSSNRCHWCSGANWLSAVWLLCALTLLGGRKDIQPVKNWVVGCWRGYLSGARCRLAYGPANASATHSLSLLSVKSRLVLSFWYRLTQLVLDEWPLNGRARACVRVCIGDCVHVTFFKNQKHLRGFLKTRTLAFLEIWWVTAAIAVLEIMSFDGGSFKNNNCQIARFWCLCPSWTPIFFGSNMVPEALCFGVVCLSVCA